jgi:hypothetical protein
VAVVSARGLYKPFIAESVAVGLYSLPVAPWLLQPARANIVRPASKSVFIGPRSYEKAQHHRCSTGLLDGFCNYLPEHMLGKDALHIVDVNLLVEFARDAR